MRKISDDPLNVCPSCGNEALQKMISKVAFRLKGTGWYETDFKNKPSEAKSDTADKPDAKTADEKKDVAAKDDKPATTGADAKKTAAKAED
jgi:predicted nucleic acid-binding Zn ribbon protein